MGSKEGGGCVGEEEAAGLELPRRPHARRPAPPLAGSAYGEPLVQRPETVPLPLVQVNVAARLALARLLEAGAQKAACPHPPHVPNQDATRRTTPPPPPAVAHSIRGGRSRQRPIHVTGEEERLPACRILREKQFRHRDSRNRTAGRELWVRVGKEHGGDREERVGSRYHLIAQK
jgi:hypothetical protein